MRLTVGHVVKLIGPDHALIGVARQLIGQPLRVAHEVIRVTVRGRRHLHQFGTGQPQHVFLFFRLGLWDHDHSLEPHRGTHQRKANARVARSAFHNRATGLQLTLRDGIFDDVERGTVLDRLAGVHELRLAQNLTPRRLARPLEFDEWCFANSVGQIRCNVHGAPRVV